jgi:hypothetical protein
MAKKKGAETYGRVYAVEKKRGRKRAAKRSSKRSKRGTYGVIPYGSKP